VSNVPRFLALLQTRGSNVRYRRSDSTIPCPCRTPEGNRDPEWHKAHPTAQICTESGFLYDPNRAVDVIVKGFMQPIQSTRATRLETELLSALFGEIQADDHLAILPIEWAGVRLNFYDWGRSGEDFVEYDNQRYTVVNANKIPDPADGNPEHHWEVGCRLISEEPLDG
jgi:hypothetical protein